MLRWLTTFRHAWWTAGLAIESALAKAGLRKRSGRAPRHANGHSQSHAFGDKPAPHMPINGRAPTAASAENLNATSDAAEKAQSVQPDKSAPDKPSETPSGEPMSGSAVSSVPGEAGEDCISLQANDTAGSGGAEPHGEQQETAAAEADETAERDHVGEPAAVGDDVTACCMKAEDEHGRIAESLPGASSAAEQNDAAVVPEEERTGCEEDHPVCTVVSAVDSGGVESNPARAAVDMISSGGEPGLQEAGEPVRESDKPGSANPVPQKRAGRGAVYKDRRGARRRAPQVARDSAAPTAPSVKRAELRLRLVINPDSREVELSAVLVRGEEFPEQLRAGFKDAAELFALDDRYDDLQLDWTPELLRHELRLADSEGRFEWVRGARDIHLFSEESGESDLVSVSAASVQARHAIVCPVQNVDAVLKIAASARSPSLSNLEGWKGIPDGWAVLDGYRPQCAADLILEERLRTLDPGTSTEILFEGGLQIRSRIWAAGRPPTIRVVALQSDGAVFIDAHQASLSADGVCTAPGWDRPGTHLVDVVPGRSASYQIAADPALDEGWQAAEGMNVRLGRICGPRIVNPVSKTVIAYPALGQVTALGKRCYARVLQTRAGMPAGMPAAIGALPFEPEFLIVSWGSRRSQGEIVWLAAARENDLGGSPDAAWAAAVCSAAARHLAIRPASEEARQAWARATVLARLQRKGRA